MLRFSICGKSYFFTFQFIGLTLLLVAIFSSLGIWQFHRAEEKRQLIEAYHARQNTQLTAFDPLFEAQDSRFYGIVLSGHFDNDHLILLDNKTLDGQLGYEVYSPFLPEGSKKAILVDRGWVPAPPNRRILPAIQPVSGRVVIKGTLNLPPRYFSLGSMTESQKPAFPLRVQYVNISELTPFLGRSLPRYLIWLDPGDPHGFKRKWTVALVGPEKHLMYTVQWFAFALSLLVIFVVLNFHRVKNNED